MVTQKKAYIRPEVSRCGDVEDITQGFGKLGSGDFIFQATNGRLGQEGCFLNNSPLCEYGSGS